MKIIEYAAGTKSYLGWFLAVGLLLSVQSVCASTLQCKFTDEEGKVLKNVEARLTLAGTEAHQFQKSNKSGEAAFPDLTGGTYEVMAQLKGYVVLKREIAIIGDRSVDLVLMTEKAFDQLDTEARTAIKNEQFSAALPTLQKLLANYPEDAALHYNLGLTYAGLQQEEKAMAEAAQAAKLDPEFANSATQVQGMLWRERGQSALKSQDFVKAGEAFEKWVKLDPKSDQAYYGLALAYGHQGKFPQALDAVNKALELAPQNNTYKSVKEILEANAGQK